jgi:hypothetical protein
MMEDSLKVREDRARRALAKRGYRLRKTPARSWQRPYYEPGYMIIEVYRNLVVEGGSQREYEANIERVEWFAFEYLPAKEAAAA